MKVKLLSGMVNFCCVPLCHSRSTRDETSFHRFPSKEREPERHVAWVRAVRRENFVVKEHTRVCGLHFPPSAFKEDEGGNFFLLKDDAIPSIFPTWPSHLQVPLKRKRRPPRDRARRVSTAPLPDEGETRSDTDSESDGSESAVTLADGRTSVALTCADAEEKQSQSRLSSSTQTAVLAGCPFDHALYSTPLDPSRRHLLRRITELENEVAGLREKGLSLEAMKCVPDGEFLDYTGFPNYKVFQALFEHLQPYASIMQYWKGKKTRTECAQPNLNLKVKKLSLEEEFLAVMIQLRCGFRHRDTARFFGISEAWFSCIFNTWICLLSDVLSDLCKFPSREVTKETMPPCFVDFPDTRIILDCTEIFSQQASSTQARKQMFSSYKHNDTYKFLVGIAPSGYVSFVSEAWGGRASDKHITLDSEELLSNLESGDAVMADRGFTISIELEQRGVTTILPAFLGKDRAQLTGQEVHKSRRVAEARVHVERAIGKMKIAPLGLAGGRSTMKESQLLREKTTSSVFVSTCSNAVHAQFH